MNRKNQNEMGNSSTDLPLEPGTQHPAAEPFQRGALGQATSLLGPQLPPRKVGVELDDSYRSLHLHSGDRYLQR